MFCTSLATRKVHMKLRWPKKSYYYLHLFFPFQLLFPWLSTLASKKIILNVLATF